MDGLSSALVQALASGESTETALRELIAQDPRLSPLADVLVRQVAPADEPVPPDDEMAEVEAAGEELAILRSLVATLARALGACERCWGSDVACANCGGDGSPGTFLPDRHLFTEWVVPAIRRLPRRHSRSPTHVPPRQPRQMHTYEKEEKTP